MRYSPKTDNKSKLQFPSGGKFACVCNKNFAFYFSNHSSQNKDTIMFNMPKYAYGSQLLVDNLHEVKFDHTSEIENIREILFLQ